MIIAWTLTDPCRTRTMGVFTCSNGGLAIGTHVERATNVGRV